MTKKSKIAWFAQIQEDRVVVYDNFLHDIISNKNVSHARQCRVQEVMFGPWIYHHPLAHYGAKTSR